MCRIFKVLIEELFDHSYSGNYPIYSNALKGNHIEVDRLLLDSNVDPRNITKDGIVDKTALFETRSLSVAISILESPKMKPITVYDLYRACRQGQEDIVMRVAEIVPADYNAFEICVLNNYASCFSILLEVDNYRLTVDNIHLLFDQCITYNSIQVAEFMMKRWAFTIVPCGIDQFPLLHCMRHGTREMFTLLLDNVLSNPSYMKYIILSKSIEEGLDADKLDILLEDERCDNILIPTQAITTYFSNGNIELTDLFMRHWNNQQVFEIAVSCGDYRLIESMCNRGYNFSVRIDDNRLIRLALDKRRYKMAALLCKMVDEDIL